MSTSYTVKPLTEEESRAHAKAIERTEYRNFLPENPDPTKTYRPPSLNPRQDGDQNSYATLRHIASRTHQGDVEVGDQRNKMFHYHETIKNSQQEFRLLSTEDQKRGAKYLLRNGTYDDTMDAFHGEIQGEDIKYKKPIDITRSGMEDIQRRQDEFNRNYNEGKTNLLGRDDDDYSKIRRGETFETAKTGEKIRNGMGEEEFQEYKDKTKGMSTLDPFDPSYHERKMHETEAKGKTQTRYLKERQGERNPIRKDRSQQLRENVRRKHLTEEGESAFDEVDSGDVTTNPKTEGLKDHIDSKKSDKYIDNLSDHFDDIDKKVQRNQDDFEKLSKDMTDRRLNTTQKREKLTEYNRKQIGYKNSDQNDRAYREGRVRDDAENMQKDASSYKRYGGEYGDKRAQGKYVLQDMGKKHNEYLNQYEDATLGISNKRNEDASKYYDQQLKKKEKAEDESYTDLGEKDDERAQTLNSNHNFEKTVALDESKKNNAKKEKRVFQGRYLDRNRHRLNYNGTDDEFTAHGNTSKDYNPEDAEDNLHEAHFKNALADDVMNRTHFANQEAKTGDQVARNLEGLGETQNTFFEAGDADKEYLDSSYITKNRKYSSNKTFDPQGDALTDRKNARLAKLTRLTKAPTQFHPPSDISENSANLEKNFRAEGRPPPGRDYNELENDLAKKLNPDDPDKELEENGEKYKKATNKYLTAIRTREKVRGHNGEVETDMRNYHRYTNKSYETMESQASHIPPLQQTYEGKDITTKTDRDLYKKQYIEDATKGMSGEKKEKTQNALRDMLNEYDDPNSEHYQTGEYDFDPKAYTETMTHLHDEDRLHFDDNINTDAKNITSSRTALSDKEYKPEYDPNTKTYTYPKGSAHRYLDDKKKYDKALMDSKQKRQLRPLFDKEQETSMRHSLAGKGGLRFHIKDDYHDQYMNPIEEEEEEDTDEEYTDEEDTDEEDTDEESRKNVGNEITQTQSEEGGNEDVIHSNESYERGSMDSIDPDSDVVTRSSSSSSTSSEASANVKEHMRQTDEQLERSSSSTMSSAYGDDPEDTDFNYNPREAMYEHPAMYERPAMDKSSPTTRNTQYGRYQYDEDDDDDDRFTRRGTMYKRPSDYDASRGQKEEEGNFGNKTITRTKVNDDGSSEKLTVKSHKENFHNKNYLPKDERALGKYGTEEVPSGDNEDTVITHEKYDADGNTIEQTHYLGQVKDGVPHGRGFVTKTVGDNTESRSGTFENGKLVKDEDTGETYPGPPEETPQDKVVHESLEKRNPVSPEEINSSPSQSVASEEAFNKQFESLTNTLPTTTPELPGSTTAEGVTDLTEMGTDAKNLGTDVNELDELAGDL